METATRQLSGRTRVVGCCCLFTRELGGAQFDTQWPTVDEFPVAQRPSPAGPATFTVLSKLCTAVHFYRFTPKPGHFYPTPTL